MEMPEKPQGEKNNYQIKNINGETFVVHVDNNDEKKFTKVVQITSDGNLIPQNKTHVVGWSPDSQNIRNEAEIKKNKIKTIAIISACCLITLIALIYAVATGADSGACATNVNTEVQRTHSPNQTKSPKVQQDETNPEAKTKVQQERKTDSLVWSNRSSDTMDWNRAKQYCENLSEDGHNDWRLPTISELRTLIQNCQNTETVGECGVTDTCLSESCKNKACNGCEAKKVHYSKLGDKGFFWSSSLLPGNRMNAWYVDFTYASINGHSENKKSVRCVR